MKEHNIQTTPLSCILLVDDDEPTNFLHEMVIKNTGLSVHVQTTLTAIEALEFLACTGRYSHLAPEYPQPGIIFLDINMPGLSGWEFLEEYHKLSEEKKARIVIAMLTTSINPDDEEKANQQEELDGFLKKPLTTDMLKTLVDKHWPGTL